MTRLKGVCRRLLTGWGSNYVLILLVIVECVLLINLTYTHLSHVIEDDKSFDASSFTPGLDEEFRKYVRMPCTMIELYNTNYDRLQSLCFNSEDCCADLPHMGTFPGLTHYFDTHETGLTLLSFGNINYEIYFEWGLNEFGERELVIIYDPDTRYDIWYIPAICFAIMLTIAALVTKIMFFDRRNNLRAIQRMQDTFQRNI
jgi:hypothetical protein